MKVEAAIAVEAGKPLEIDEIELEGPKQGECLIRLEATGVCHTDAFTLSGDDPEGLFPAILGHEGAGVVEEVGPGVTSLEVGDHVIEAEEVVIACGLWSREVAAMAGAHMPLYACEHFYMLTKKIS